MHADSDSDVCLSLHADFIIPNPYIIVDSAPSSNLAMYDTFIIPNP